ncbi:MAG: glycogen-binding domain-containing protein [Gemmatimonadota bacterium]
MKYDTRNVSVGGQGSLTVFETGNRIVQLTASAGWLSAARARWRVELSGAAGLSKYAEADATAHAVARSRLHFFGSQRGGWLSIGTGASITDSARVPFELGLGAWRVRQRLSLIGTAAAVWIGEDSYVDVTAAAKWTSRSRVEIEALGGVRPFANSSGAPGEAKTGAWGELATVVPLSRNISLTVSGGSYQSDPVRRALGATYATAGLEIALAGARAARVVIPAAARERITSGGSARARLEIESEDGGYVLRIHAASVQSVEIMADFSDWQPMPLIALGNDRWRLQLQLEAGVYRLNVRVDGGEWFAPGGARSEQDEFGGVVGVIVIQ